MHGHTSVGRPAKTYIQNFCYDNGCNPDVLPRTRVDRNGWRKRERERERESGKSMPSVRLNHDDDDDL